MAQANIFHRMMQSLAIIVLLAWLCLSLLIYACQANFVYYPNKTLMLTPDNLGLDHDEVNLKTSDGVRLHGWYLPGNEPRGTLLFLHGNAGNISHRLDSLQIFHDLGLSVLIIDYRGYGLSEGSPTEEGTYRDAETAWQYLTRKKSVPAEQIIIFGRSLGGAIATWLATQHTPAGLIIESSFTSTVDMGKQIYPFLPMKLITRIKYPNLERIPSIECPVLVIHSRDDEIVPYEQGQELFAAAKEPRYFLEIHGDHNQGFMQSGATYTNGLGDFLNRYLPAKLHEPAQPN